MTGLAGDAIAAALTPPGIGTSAYTGPGRLEWVEPDDIQVEDKYRDAVPPLDAADRKNLRDSIRQHGIREPLIVDADDWLLDGHHRLAVAQELNLDQIPVLKISRPLPLADGVTYAIEANLHRRHLTEYQKLEMGQNIIAQEEQRARNAKRAGKKTAGGRTSERIAARLNMSKDSVKRGRKVLEQTDPDDVVRDLLRTGKKSLKEAADEIDEKKKRERRDRQAALPIAGSAGGSSDALPGGHAAGDRYRVIWLDLRGEEWLADDDHDPADMRDTRMHTATSLALSDVITHFAARPTCILACSLWPQQVPNAAGLIRALHNIDVHDDNGKSIDNTDAKFLTLHQVSSPDPADHAEPYGGMFKAHYYVITIEVGTVLSPDSEPNADRIVPHCNAPNAATYLSQAWPGPGAYFARLDNKEPPTTRWPASWATISPDVAAMAVGGPDAYDEKGVATDKHPDFGGDFASKLMPRQKKKQGRGRKETAARQIAADAKSAQGAANEAAAHEEAKGRAHDDRAAELAAQNKALSDESDDWSCAACGSFLPKDDSGGEPDDFCSEPCRQAHLAKNPDHYADACDDLDKNPDYYPGGGDDDDDDDATVGRTIAAQNARAAARSERTIARTGNKDIETLEAEATQKASPQRGDPFDHSGAQRALENARSRAKVRKAAAAHDDAIRDHDPSASNVLRHAADVTCLHCGGYIDPGDLEPPADPSRVLFCGAACERDAAAEAKRTGHRLPKKRPANPKASARLAVRTLIRRARLAYLGAATALSQKSLETRFLWIIAPTDIDPTVAPLPELRFKTTATNKGLRRVRAYARLADLPAGAIPVSLSKKAAKYPDAVDGIAGLGPDHEKEIAAICGSTRLAARIASTWQHLDWLIPRLLDGTAGDHGWRHPGTPDERRAARGVAPKNSGRPASARTPKKPATAASRGRPKPKPKPIANPGMFPDERRHSPDLRDGIAAAAARRKAAAAARTKNRKRK